MRARAKLQALTLYAIYAALILTAASGHLMAASSSDGGDGEFRYDLRFTSDGRSSHYTAVRHDPGQPATVNVLYDKGTNTLSLSARNLKNITVHTRDVFMDEGDELFGVDPASDDGYYKEYFSKRSLMTINLETTQGLDTVVLEDIIRPNRLLINGVIPGEAGVKVAYRDGDVIVSDVPAGLTEVELHFDGGADTGESTGEGAGSGVPGLSPGCVFGLIVVGLTALVVLGWLAQVRKKPVDKKAFAIEALNDARLKREGLKKNVSVDPGEMRKGGPGRRHRAGGKRFAGDGVRGKNRRSIAAGKRKKKGGKGGRVTKKPMNSAQNRTRRRSSGKGREAERHYEKGMSRDEDGPAELRGGGGGDDALDGIMGWNE